MTRLVIAFAFLATLSSCGAQPDPVARHDAAFTCARISPFTHLCTQYVPSLIPGAPINDVPSGDPQWCPDNNNAIPDGWAMVLNDQPVSGGRYCAFVPAGYYATLGDWDYDSTLAGVPSVHVRTILTGAHAYAFAWDAPGFGGNFINYYPPGSVVDFTSTVRSFELLDGQ